MSITFRLEKGVELTHEELDNNFKFLHKWSSSKVYNTGMYVAYNYSIYECIIAHTSISVFEPTKWQRFSAIGISGTGNGITYFWNNLTEQNLTVAQTGERGVRMDEIGRPVYEFNGVNWVLVQDPNIATNKFYLDGDLNTIPYTNPKYPSILTAKQGMDEALYVALKATLNITTSVLFEKGQTINNVSLNWTYSNGNAIIAQQIQKTDLVTLVTTNESTPAIPASSANLVSQNITNSTKYTITLEDNVSSVIAIAQINIYNSIYWGKSSIPITFDTTFIHSLSNSEISANGEKTITFNLGSDEYFYFAIPNSYSPVEFLNESLGSALDAVALVSHTNLSGYTENYTVYQSTFDNLGNTTIIVKKK